MDHSNSCVCVALFDIFQNASVGGDSLFPIFHKFGMYFNSLFPAVPAKVAGVAILLIFFLINLGGVNVMAKVQKYGTWLLIGGLMLFIIAGLFQIKYPAIFDVMADDFMASGSKGFTSAIATFMYSTVGYSLLMTSCLAFVYFLAFYLLPTKYPEAWATMHVPNGVYYGIVTVALAVQLYIFYNACRNLTAKTVIISLVAMVVCMAYGFIRAKSPSVQIKTSTWEE